MNYPYFKRFDLMDYQTRSAATYGTALLDMDLFGSTSGTTLINLDLYNSTDATKLINLDRYMLKN